MGIIDAIKSFFGIGKTDEPKALPPITDELIAEINKEIAEKKKNEPKKPRDVIEFFIVGTYYRGMDARDRRAILKKGERLLLKKDHRNRYSDHALRIYTEDNVWIGYVDDYHSLRIWEDMEKDEGEAEYFECRIGMEYNQDDDFIGYYRIPNFEEKYQAKLLKRRVDAAIKDLQTPEGRLEPGDVDYQSLPKEELMRMKKNESTKLKKRMQKESTGDIPESGPIRELHDVQVSNLNKTLQAINDALSRFTP